MPVAVQLSVLGLYLPPLLDDPPQTIISLPLQTALGPKAVVAFVGLMAVQVSVLGSYLPPPAPSPPLFTIISLPVQTAELPEVRGGALVVLMAVQLSVLGLYLPPVFSRPVMLFCPPQTIISLPVQNAKWYVR